MTAPRSRLRQLLVPGLTTILLATLAFGLGVWQVERLAWKTAILARIDAAEAAPAVPFAGEPAQFTKIAVTGRFRAVPPVLYGAEVRDTPAGPRMGARLIQPLERDALPPVLVDRGWAPTDHAVLPPPPDGVITVEGYIRTADRPVWFAAADDPVSRRFFTMDPAKMAAALGVATAPPYVVVALGKASAAQAQPATALPRPPNDHLSYAVTWFSLSAILLVIFAIFARKVLRRMNNPSASLPNTPPYARLTRRFTRIATINEAAAMLGWDASAMMPPGGGEARGDQLAVLAGLSHGLLTEPATADEIAEAEAAPPEDEWDSANLALIRHAHTRATALPPDLVEAQSRANSTCEKVWRTARADSDFAAVAPFLAEVVNLTRQAASALAPALGLAPYDALMDGYQAGIGAADVGPVFADYERFLAIALPAALERQAAQPAPVMPRGPFPEAAQEALCRALSERVGLDYRSARLDRSTHPFCGGTPTDVRITTRYNTQDFAQSVLGVLHETGHAMYERGLPKVFARQPVGEAAGMAAHESQSLIVEMQAVRSDAFLSFLGPQLHAAFGGDAAAYAPGNLARMFRHVGRGFIRVEADEMTYPAHVILRFRLEQALIGGDLAVVELPGAWNDGLQSLLAIRPPNDAVGCLQDIHWYDGAFGYFPSYTLGAMAAAQLMAAARRALPDLDSSLAQGDLAPLMGWLGRHVHSQGSRLGFNDLLRAATGKPLDPADFTAHLTARYLS